MNIINQFVRPESADLALEAVVQVVNSKTFLKQVFGPQAASGGAEVATTMLRIIGDWQLCCRPCHLPVCGAAPGCSAGNDEGEQVQLHQVLCGVSHQVLRCAQPGACDHHP